MQRYRKVFDFRKKFAKILFQEGILRFSHDEFFIHVF